MFPIRNGQNEVGMLSEIKKKKPATIVRYMVYCIAINQQTPTTGNEYVQRVH